MRTPKKIWLIAIALVLTGGPALAHDRGGHVAYPDDRWSGAVTIYGGTNEVQLNIIAKRVLGLPD